MKTGFCATSNRFRRCLVRREIASVAESSAVCASNGVCVCVRIRWSNKLWRGRAAYPAIRAHSLAVLLGMISNRYETSFKG